VLRVGKNSLRKAFAEKQEANAYQQRFVKLTNIATEKKCDFLMVTPDFTQSSSQPQQPIKK